jgi:hypothetical protein
VNPPDEIYDKVKNTCQNLYQPSINVTLVLLLVTRTDTACDTDFAMYYALFNIILSFVYYRKYVALAIYDFTV